jgi:hypothetical protein
LTTAKEKKMRDEKNKPSGYLINIKSETGAQIVVTCTAKDYQVGVHRNKQEALKYIEPTLPASGAALDAAMQRILICDEVVASIQSALGPLNVTASTKSLGRFSPSQPVFYVYVQGQSNAWKSFARSEDAHAEAKRLADQADQQHDEKIGVSSPDKSPGASTGDSAATKVTKAQRLRPGKP